MNKYSLISHPKYGYKEICPTPSDEEIAEFYANEFYASSKPQQINDSSLDVQKRDHYFYQSAREDIKRLVETSLGEGNHSIFDFGCGWCETLSYFQTQGYDCFGVDPAPEAIAHGQESGLNVLQSDLKILNPFERKFDCVLMQNVLEHLPAPEQIVTRIKTELLREGGLLIIDVPNEFNALQCAANEIHGLNEWWVAPPAHLNYFNPDSLRALLIDKGYRIIEERSSFPMEMFLLMGRQYVGDGEVGRQCHVERMLFEENLRRTGRTEALHGLYRALAKENLGRQILTVAQSLP